MWKSSPDILVDKICKGCYYFKIEKTLVNSQKFVEGAIYG